MIKIILSIVLFIQAFSYSFEEYIVEFKRNYTSLEQKLQRETIFNQRMAKYQQINSQNNQFTLGPTKWTDRFETEIQQSFVNNDVVGRASTPIQTSEIDKLRSIQDGGIDWREKAVTSVKDQGSCGCCWSFAAVAAFESWIMNKNSTTHNISQEYVLQCTGPQNTCNGGYIHQAMQLLIRTGAPNEQTYPYVAYNYGGTGFPRTTGICNTNKRIKMQQNVTYKQVYRTNKQVMMSMLDQGPLSTGIVSDDFLQGYRSGILSCNYNFSTSVNHAVQIVGYNVSKNYYIIKNSWGTDWGMNGFGYIDMDKDCLVTKQVYQFTWSHRLLPILIMSVLFIIF